MNHQQHNRGLIKEIVLIVIAVIILSLFGVDLRERAKSPLIKQNLYFVWGSATSSVTWLWDKVAGFTNMRP